MRSLKVSIKPRESRIDKFLTKKFKDLTRSQIKKLIKQGNILVNSQQVDPDYLIKKNDVVTTQIPPPKPLELKAEAIPLHVVYEDECILVIDKEAGIVTHPTMDHPTGTLVNALIHHIKNIPGLGQDLRPGIVHRLDKGTSGLMVVGKKQTCVENLKNQFRKRRVVKKYTLVVGGKVEPAVGSINKPIARHPKHRQKFAILEGGRESRTDYKVIETFRDKFTLLEACPKTGRTHQIRVHFSSLGHPLVGDKLYGGSQSPRMFLHASYLEFDHPETGKRLNFESRLPVKLTGILGKIRKELGET